VRIGELVLDLHSRRVLGDGRPVQLSPLEARILHILALHQDDVVPYTQLLESVWDGDEKGSVAALKTHVSHLRKKLVASSRRARARNWINMVSGVGYCLSVAGHAPRRTAAA
jgi:DNA-binding response OmpR family regulator